MGEIEWTFSDVFAQMNTFLKASILSFFREVKSDWNILAAMTTMEENLSAKLSITSSPNYEKFLTLLFFHVRQLFRGRMPYSYIKKQLRRNSLQLQSFDAFAVLMDYDGSKKVTKLFLPYSIILWAQWTYSILSLSLSIVGILLTLLIYSCLK